MFTFLAIPLVRKIGGAALVLLALSSVAFAIYHAGVHTGAQAEAGRQAETNKIQFDQIQRTLAERLAADREEKEGLRQMMLKFADLAAQASTRQQAAQQASVVDKQKVENLSDSAIKGDLEMKLGGLLENPFILRKADEIVTDYPHKLDELKGAKDEVAATIGKLETAQKQTANAEKDRDAVLDAYNQVLPLYTQAYNAAIQGHRKWYCLWLCKKKKKIGLPEPVTLGMKLAAAKAH